jgi:Domain found in Dishevelled, Egl-10, and Pleckstrin (DEP)
MKAAQHATAARTRIWLDLPSGGGADTLRAALMAMGLIPQPLPLDPAPRRQALATLTAGALAFLDVSDPALHGARPLSALVKALPDPSVAGRIMLSRTQGGHVSPQDRAWVRGLGFADLLPDWLGGPDRAGLREVVAWVARATGLDEPASQEWLTYTRVLAGAARDQGAARAIVWGLTGESPEACVARLADSLDITDRRWRLQDYPRCFIGGQAVEHLMHSLRRPREEVLALGQALGDLGLLVHVMQEHPFLDQDLFYRLAWSDALDRVDAGDLWQTAEEGLPRLTNTRSHHGREYADCFVGEEAVALVADRHGLHRVDAWLALHRITQWGWIEHVTRARPFIDGHFFYRWRRTRDRAGA